MANPFIHIELNTTDLPKAKDFYGKLFAWKLEDMEMGPGMTYTMIKIGDDNATGGGMLTHPMPGQPSAWLPYVLVDDVKAATAKAKSLGANVIADVAEVPNMGYFSIIMDPTGGVLGLWETKRGG